jgi:SAM-dependent methyltransferase
MPYSIRIIAITALSITSSVLAQPETHPLRQIKRDAQALKEVFVSPDAHAMLEQAALLPVLETRTIHIATRPNRGFTQAQFEALGEQEREGLQAFEIDAARYYSTFYGSPLVYARTLDLLNVHMPQFEIDGARIMDLGYGQVGQLRLWAQMGAHVTGVEVDPILTAMYDGCAAVGDIKDAGSVRLIECAWPNEASCRSELGTGFDLIVSRNLLKKGYVKPAQLNPSYPVPVAWGMDDEAAVQHFYDALAPGGVVVIESLGPKPDPAKPWSDIANPWDRSAWEAAGFEVIAHDEDESMYARAMGRALGWDAQMDLEEALFAVYSFYRKPADE